MCNCGHCDDGAEADRLRRLSVKAGLAALALCVFPALLATSQGHGLMLALVVLLQCILAGVALHAYRRRTALLRG